MEHFALDENVDYFDCAGRSPLPLSVERVGHDSVSWKLKPWKSLPNFPQEIAQKYSKLIRAESADCIALAPSTTFAMTLAAENIIRSGILCPGKFVVVMFGEMESSVYAWQSACQRTGATLLVVPPPDDSTTWSEAIISTLDTLSPGDLAVIVLTCVHWCSGRTVDALEISHHIRASFERNKAKDSTLPRPHILLDGTQSIGIEPFDVQQIQPDLVTCSVHKWLLSPYGTSLLYLHPRHHATWQPLDQHDRSRLGNNEPEWVEVSGMHSSLNPVYPLAFQWGARCISSGGRPNPILLPMISSALDLILETFCGPESLLSHVSNLTDLFLRCIETDSSEPSHQSAIPEEVRQSPTEARYSPIGILILPRKLLSQHILGLRLHPSVSLSPSEICYRLEEMGIKISVRQSYLRISPYLYNTPQQMIRLYTQLRQIIVTGGRKTLESPLTLLPFVHSPKILIIGGSGWLGQYVFKRLQHQCPLLLSRQHEIHVTYCSNPPHFLPSHCRHRIDLSSSCPSSEIDDLLATLKPEIILHLAAQSSLMKCDRDPQAAALSNCPLPLIEAVKRHVPNALFVYTSTDIVYDGICPPFHPLSPSSLSSSSCPSTTYGKTKLLFEYEVLSLPKGLVLRLSNMIGGGYVYESPSQNAGMKFLQWLQKNYLLKNSISLKNDEKRSFVSVHDVTMLIQRIVELSLGNDSESHECWSQRIHNVGGPIGLSRLELAEILCRVQNCELLIEGKDNGSDKEKDKHKVTEASHSKSSWRVSSVSSESLKSSNPLDTVAPRDVTMDISLTESHFGIQFHDLSEVLASILADF